MGLRENTWQERSGLMERSSRRMGQQDGIVPGVAPAIGAADDHLIPSVFLVAENGFIDLHLPLNGGFDGELSFAFS